MTVGQRRVTSYHCWVAACRSRKRGAESSPLHAVRAARAWQGPRPSRAFAVRGRWRRMRAARGLVPWGRGWCPLA